MEMVDKAVDENFSEEGIHSLAQLCHTVLYRHGIGGWLRVLLEASRQFCPISRINGVFISKNGEAILNIFDTHPNDRMVPYYISPKQTLEMDLTRNAWKKKVAIVPESIDKTTLINDLTKYKNRYNLNDSMYKGIPFLQHNSLLRLPLFNMDPFVFVINFWSDDTNVFNDIHIHLIKELIEPIKPDLEKFFISSNSENSIIVENSHSETQRPFLDFYVQQLARCPGLQEVCIMIKKVAKTDATVIIQGETGTGKEFVACAIHEQSMRREKPFVVVNCGAIPSTLVESELFGHEKGAFTGAINLHKGYFEQAQGGTIFLDEVGDLPLSAQVKLLRVLEKGHLVRVGSSKAIRLDVRIIAATNINLDAKMAKGLFRKDLWYRLAVFPIYVPPLRERTEDIPPLVKAFLVAKIQSLNVNFHGNVSENEIRRLYEYDWPGNVRELEHVIERSLIMHDNDKGILHFLIPNNLGMYKDLSQERKITPSKIDEKDKKNTIELAEGDHWLTLKEFENYYIKETLKKTGGTLLGKNGAATLLGISYSTLRAKMLAMGIPLPREVHRKSFSSKSADHEKK